MSEECKDEQEDRTWLDDLWDIFVACITVLVSFLLVLSLLDFLASILGALLASSLGSTLAWILSMIFFLLFFLWNFFRKAFAFFDRLRDILERRRTATEGVK
jgi:cytochrome c biogenesis protein CcdA